MSEFDFDVMMNLYKENPEKFEEEKIKLLDDAITEMSDDPEVRQRLEAMLFSQEQGLSKFKDPVARFNEVQTRFYKQSGKFRAAINSPEYLKLQKRAEVLKLQIIEK